MRMLLQGTTAALLLALTAGGMDAASISWLQDLLSREFRMKFH